MSEFSVTKNIVMATTRKRGSKYNFKYAPGKKSLSQPYIFIRGDVPLLTDSEYAQFPNTDKKATRIKFNSKASFKAAELSILG